VVFNCQTSNCDPSAPGGGAHATPICSDPRESAAIGNEPLVSTNQEAALKPLGGMPAAAVMSNRPKPMFRSTRVLLGDVVVGVTAPNAMVLEADGVESNLGPLAVQFNANDTMGCVASLVESSSTCACEPEAPSGGAHVMFSDRAAAPLPKPTIGNEPASTDSQPDSVEAADTPNPPSPMFEIEMLMLVRSRIPAALPTYTVPPAADGIDEKIGEMAVHCTVYCTVL
jgi:hypothetical protein